MKTQLIDVPILEKDRKNLIIGAICTGIVVWIYIFIVREFSMGVASILPSSAILFPSIVTAWYKWDFARSYYVRSGDFRWNSQGIYVLTNTETEYDWCDLQSFYVVADAGDLDEVDQGLVSKGDFTALVTFCGGKGKTSFRILLSDDLLEVLHEKERTVQELLVGDENDPFELNTLDRGFRTLVVYLLNASFLYLIVWLLSVEMEFILIVFFLSILGFPGLLLLGDDVPFAKDGKLKLKGDEIILQKGGKTAVSIRLEDCQEVELNIVKGYRTESDKIDLFEGIYVLKIKSRNFSGDIKFETATGSDEARLIQLFFKTWKVKYPQVVSYVGRDPGLVYSVDLLDFTVISDPPLSTMSIEDEDRDR